MQGSPPEAKRLFKDELALVIDWTDGHQSRLVWPMLRAHCPCAQCREEGAARAPGIRAEPGPDGVRPRRVERVGRYAVSVLWEDGHTGGIFAWSLLRELCDCFQCRQDRQGD
jgi:DUF971 family protein